MGNDDDGQGSGSFDRLGVAITGPPLGLDPHVTGGGANAPLLNMFEGLVTRLPDRSLAPTLLERDLERIDATTWRGTLRSDRKFSDGSPITMDDVEYSFARLKDKATGAYKAQFVELFDIVIRDKTTIEFKAEVPVDFLPQRVAIVSIVPQKVAEAKGLKGFARDPGVGSGPMINDGPHTQTTVKLRRVNGYNGLLKTYTTRALYTYIPEEETRVNQLRSGQVEFVSDLGPTVREAVRGDSRLEVGVNPLDKSTRVKLVFFNTKKAPFDDVRVRQAFLYAIDRDQLIEIAEKGQATKADSPLPSWHPLHQSPSTVYDHDPERARRLLAEAGHSDGVDFQLWVSEEPGTKEYAPLLEQQLRAVGMRAKLRVIGLDPVFPEVSAGKHDAFVVPTAFEVFSPDEDMLIRGWWGGFFSETVAFWDNAQARRIPELLDQALEQREAERKTEIYTQVAEIINSEAANVPLLFTPIANAWSKEVAGFQNPFTIYIPVYKVRPA